MKKKFDAFFLGCIALVSIASGCATASRLRDISVGMAREDVLRVMGNPEDMRYRKGGSEVFMYSLKPGLFQDERRYLIILDDGRVSDLGPLPRFLQEFREQEQAKTAAQDAKIEAYMALTPYERCFNNPIEGKNAWKRHGSVKNCVLAKTAEQSRLEQEGDRAERQQAARNTAREAAREQAALRAIENSNQFYRNMGRAFEQIGNGISGAGTIPAKRIRCTTQPNPYSDISPTQTDCTEE